MKFYLKYPKFIKPFYNLLFIILKNNIFLCYNKKNLNIFLLVSIMFIFIQVFLALLLLTHNVNISSLKVRL